MALSVNDVVVVSLGGNDGVPPMSVLGVVTAASDGRRDRPVQVLVGAKAQSAQIISAVNVRRIASGATMPWSGTDTHTMIRAASRKPGDSRGTVVKKSVAPITKTLFSPPLPAPVASASPQHKQRIEPPLRGKVDEYNKIPLAELRSLPSSSPLDPEEDVSGGGAATVPPPPGVMKGGNVLQGACLAVDTVLCGSSLRLSALFFGVLMLWVMLCAAKPRTAVIAAAKLCVALVGVLLCVIAQPSVTERHMQLGSPAALCRLALVCAVVVTADSSLVVTGIPFLALVASCAHEFDKRERGRQ